MAILPHPCYVYTVCFSHSDTGADPLVFTGAYDSVIRVWSITSDSYKVHVLFYIAPKLPLLVLILFCGFS